MMLLLRMLKYCLKVARTIRSEVGSYAHVTKRVVSNTLLFNQPSHLLFVQSFIVDRPFIVATSLFIFAIPLYAQRHGLSRTPVQDYDSRALVHQHTEYRTNQH